MRIKKWIALMLAASMTFSELGTVTVFAEDKATEEKAAEAKVEEVADEAEEETADEKAEKAADEEAVEEVTDEEIVEEIADQTEAAGEAEAALNSETKIETEADDGNVSDKTYTDDVAADADIVQNDEIKTAFIHIGQLREGEELSEIDYEKFVYDQPVSFEKSDNIRLFINTNLDEIFDSAESGTIVWSILRGKTEFKEGSVNIIGEADDWAGFETVSASPYFKLVESEGKENDNDKTVELIVPTDTVVSDFEDVEEGIGAVGEVEDSYNYYIRAAYYPETKEDGEKEFYAAVTVPFLPAESDSLGNERKDGSVSEGIDTDEVQDDGLTDIVNEEESSTKENHMEDDIADEGSGDIAAASDDSGEGAEADTTKETIAGLAEEDEEQGLEETDRDGINISKLTLNKKALTMYVGESETVTASIVPEGLSHRVYWESSDDEIAWVENVRNSKDTDSVYIHAISEGTAEITAECEGMQAVVTVEVVRSDADKNNDDRYNGIVDISGDIWIAGFKNESEDLVYSGQKITQDLRVYHNETLLKENTDYKLSYKNNINAASGDSLKAPSVTISMKGQYSGSVTLYYTIKPLDINKIDTNGSSQSGESASPGYEQAVSYSTALKIPVPVLTYGKKKLALNKDFVCDYSTLPKDYKNGASYKEGEVYSYTVNGKGNFTGSFTMQLAVVKDKGSDFGAASVKLDQKQYEYNGSALSKQAVKVTEVKLNGQTLGNSDYDYEVCAQEPEGAYVNVYPTQAGRDKGYRGCKKITLKLVGDRKINEAVSGNNWKDNIVFSQKILNEEGGIYQASTDILAFGAEKEPLIEGIDYTIKYSNVKKAGKVTVTFTGKGRYKGTLKKSYVIEPDKELQLIFLKTDSDNRPVAAYQKGGAVPEFVIKDRDGIVLKNKTDYTVKVTNNKNVGSELTCTVNGKGNYKGYTTSVNVKVTEADISQGSISIPDKAYSEKPDSYRAKVTINDTNGKKLAEGTDYEKEFEYKYYDSETGTYKLVAGNSSPKAGDTVYVTVNGKGNYTGSITGSFRLYTNSISKLKIKIDEKEYTGKEIELSKSADIHVYADSANMNKNIELADKLSCFEITGYKNNVKAGTAKVTLRGLGNYGGEKTYSFKIKKKTYGINKVKSIKLSETSRTISLEEEKVTLTANIEPANAGNQTVIWTSSNSDVVEVAEDVKEEGKKGSGTVSVALKVKKEGNATITATTQDGNKKAECRITVLYSPILKQADQTIRLKAEETYQLEFEEPKIPGTTIKGVEWESSNTDMVSVDKNGLVTMHKGAAVISVYTCNRAYVQQCYFVTAEEDVLPEGNWLKIEKREGTANDNAAFSDITYNWMNYYAGSYDGIYVPAGVYMINTIQAIPVWNISNMKIYMSSGAILMAIANDSDGEYNVISITNSDHITVTGGQIIGERYGHKGTKGESGHGIGIYSSNNVHIDGVDISSCWGDGIYVGLAYESEISCDSVEIMNCNVHNNRRNNLSITAGDNVTIDNCQFNNAKGTDPQYGIDIETNTGDPCEHIKILNTKMLGNAKGSMGIMTSANDILLENCELDGILWNDAGRNVVLKNTNVKSIQGKRKDDVKRQ